MLSVINDVAFFVLQCYDIKRGGGMKFCFTVDDNIRFLKELTENNYNSLFDHPYLKMYKRLHKQFGLKVQLNLFYEMDGFNLSKMTDKYLAEWKENSDWLKLSFHSKLENESPYEFSGYDEVYADCKAVQDDIIRFASNDALAYTTTIHYCRTTDKGLKALKDNDVQALLGLFGTEEKPRTSYGLSDRDAGLIRKGEIVANSGIAFGGIDIILNLYDVEDILGKLNMLVGREIKVMIHEQYFYPDYKWYQESFEEKLFETFSFLRKNGYESCFFEDII